MMARARTHAWEVVVWVAMFGWATTLFFAMRDLYLDVRLARYDLGNMTQAVWSTAHGRVLEVTDGVTGEQLTRVGQHVDPILAALTPFWIVAPSPMTLVAVQIVAVALGALPVLWLGRRHFGSEGDAALFALAYLAYPWIAWVAMDGFHPLTLSIPLLLFAIWFLDSDRLFPFALCAIAAATCGELVGVWIAALGFWYAFARGRRRPGLMISVLGLAWTAVAVRAVVPAFSGESSDYFGVYDAVGGSPVGVVRTAVTDPLAILSAVTQGGDVFYLAMLAVPACRHVRPGARTGCSRASAARRHAPRRISGDDRSARALHRGHRSVPRRCDGAGPRSALRGEAATLFVLVLTLCVAFAVVIGPWPGTPGRSITSYWANVTPVKVEALRRAVALVPPGAPASVTNRLGSQLAERQYLLQRPRRRSRRLDRGGYRRRVDSDAVRRGTRSHSFGFVRRADSAGR